MRKQDLFYPASVTQLEHLLPKLTSAVQLKRNASWLLQFLMCCRKCCQFKLSNTLFTLHPACCLTFCTSVCNCIVLWQCLVLPCSVDSLRKQHGQVSKALDEGSDLPSSAALWNQSLHSLFHSNFTFRQRDCQPCRTGASCLCSPQQTDFQAQLKTCSQMNSSSTESKRRMPKFCYAVHLIAFHGQMLQLSSRPFFCSFEMATGNIQKVQIDTILQQGFLEGIKRSQTVKMNNYVILETGIDKTYTQHL